MEAEVVEEQTDEQMPVEDRYSKALATRPPAAVPVDLFPGATPAEVLNGARDVANALKPVLEQQNMTTRIGSRDHVQVEGWQTLGALLKVTPVCVDVRRIEPPTTYTAKAHRKKWGKVDGKRQVVEETDFEYEVDGYDWQATVEARTLDGRTIGSATSMVSRREHEWAEKDDYALIGMAQTRATSRALGSVLRFVITLAGYSGTPAEEMPRDQPAAPVIDRASDEDQRKARNALGRIVRALGGDGNKALAIYTDSLGHFDEVCPKGLAALLIGLDALIPDPPADAQ